MSRFALGGRPTVGPQTLDLLIGVRIPASQLELVNPAYFVRLFFACGLRSSDFLNFQLLCQREILLCMARSEMGIAHRSLNVSMPQPLLHCPNINTVLHPLRCTVMPQIVKSNPPHVG